MDLICSSCANTGELKLLCSKSLPGSRYLACELCREEGREPRPLVLLGAIYGDTDVAKRLIKDRRYLGEEIKASEIL